MNRTAKAMLNVWLEIDFLDWHSIADGEDEKNSEGELFTFDECRCVVI
jgi:hypothetical protein